MIGRSRFLRDTRAVASAELAMILPAVAFIILNVVDLGFYIFTRMQVDLAAQSAVGAARVLCDQDTEYPAMTNCAGLSAAMTSAAQTTTLAGSVTIANTDEKSYCADATGTLIEAGTPASPSADCAAVVAGSTTKPGLYIGATTTYTFTPIFPGASVAAYLTSPIQRTAWLRLK